MSKLLASIIARIKTALIDRFTLSASALVAQVSKLEQKIERTIDKELRSLSKLADAAYAIEQAKAVKNTHIDATYKLLNGISRIIS